MWVAALPQGVEGGQRPRFREEEVRDINEVECGTSDVWGAPVHISWRWGDTLLHPFDHWVDKEKPTYNR